MYQETQFDEHLTLDRWVGQRDEPALAELIAAHRPMVAGVCRRILGAGLEAEEVADEVFADLATGAAAIRGPVGAWLRSCATYRACRRRRTLARGRRLTPDDATWIAPCAAGNVGDGLHDRIVSAMDALDSGERGVIEQRFFLNQTPAEIASAAGISPHAVRKRIGSALGHLRRQPAMRQLYAEAL